uniref:BLOC-1-related complex subunit 7 n=1 Tax=Zonotrichia albicollis TaxID=44394 RepID=A0A8D2MDT7_ZONAL
MTGLEPWGVPGEQGTEGPPCPGLLQAGWGGDTDPAACLGSVPLLTPRHTGKGSPRAALLGQAARNMVMQEDAILHSEDSLRKMAIITTHLQYHVERSSNLQDQLSHLLK